MPKTQVPPDHQCKREERFAISDARGIFCCYACPTCETSKRAKYRPEIFTDSNYWTDEAVEES